MRERFWKMSRFALVCLAICVTVAVTGLRADEQAAPAPAGTYAIIVQGTKAGDVIQQLRYNPKTFDTQAACEKFLAEPDQQFAQALMNLADVFNANGVDSLKVSCESRDDSI
jgi:hypothetical protein